MKAVTYTSYGDPSVLTLSEVETPTPKDDEVLVEVHSSTMNRTDCGFRSARYFISRFVTGLFKPKYQIAGSEFAGVIVAVGSKVTKYKIGDRVFGFDDVRAGGNAEFVAKKEDSSIANLPGFIPFEVGAAAGEGATYALNIIRAAKIEKGQSVMVYGASGAIGSAAVQLLKALDVRVTAVCNTKNVARVKSLRPDIVIDYETTDFTKQSEKYDLILDAVGKSSYGVCKKLLKPTGKYCSSELGKFAQNPLLAIWFSATKSRKVLFPIPKINKEILSEVQSRLQSKAYKPLIDRTYTLEQIVEAAQYVETGQKSGNVVITIKQDRSATAA